MDTIQLTTNIIDGKPQVGLMLIPKATEEERIATIITVAKITAFGSRFPLAIFSMEMTNTRLFAHLLADSARHDVIEALEAKQANGELQQKIDTIKGKPLYIDDTPALSVSELKEKASKLVKEHGVEVIIIDYLELLESCDMDSLNDIAKELGALLIVLTRNNHEQL